MKRRDFLTAGLAAGLAPMGAMALGAQRGGSRHYYELRLYHTGFGDQKNTLNQYLSDALIPAWNRLGIEPVGAFTPVYGYNQPTLYVLLPHPSLESVETTGDRLMADKRFLRDGEKYLNLPMSDPAYARIESWLLRAFEGMPMLEQPAISKNKERRIFELRTYESQNLKAGKKKVEMFNNGEIDIFKRAGLNPVFYAETLIGQRRPNLTYMLVHQDMEHRDANWSKFSSDPQWKKMSSDPQYADIVSNISDYILRPTGYSQL